MSKRILIIGVLVIGTGSLFTAIVAGPESPRGYRPEDFQGRTLKWSTPAQRKKRARQPKPRVALLGPSTYHFGTLDPLTRATHTFVIRNQGTAPLKLRQGTTTCKCTLSHLNEDPIPAGGTGRVLLEWNTGPNTPAYRHSATVHTNDPLQKTLVFSVEGVVRARFSALPASLVFSEISPCGSPSAEAVLYTQTLNDLEILDAMPSRQDIGWEVTPLDESSCRELAAKSAFRLRVTLPDRLEPGYLAENLRIRARANGADDVRLEVPIQGKVLRRLAVYGPEIDTTGCLDLGRVPIGTDAAHRLTLKVRDKRPQLDVTRIAVRPEFLRVNLEPYRPHLGLYFLHIRVPKNAPRYRLPSNQHGALDMFFDHPRIPQLHLTLDVLIDRPPTGSPAR